MGHRLTCPCGEQVFACTDGDLVARAVTHLANRHPGRTYAADEILAMSVPFPDRLLPDPRE